MSTLTWIPIDRPFTLPPDIKKAIQKISEAGYVAYVVGGSVRDFLLERTPKDHDLATDCPPDTLCEIFPDAITVGKAYGVIKVPHEDPSQGQFEVSTFREDLGYENHRHPKKVRFSNPQKDSQRRDFSINALYYDAKTQKILDLVGGMNDLKKGIIRAINDPKVRFQEDALRILRAVRFSSVLEFEIEKDTSDAIQKSARLLKKISFERIRNEISQMLVGKNPDRSMKLLADLQILPYILPEMNELKRTPHLITSFPEKNAWTHTLETVKALSKFKNIEVSNESTLLWAALLINIGKPLVYKNSKMRSLNGHETIGSKIASDITKRLRFTRAETKEIRYLIQEQVKFRDVFQMRESTLIRWLREPFFPALLKLHYADAMASDGNLAYYEFCYRRLKEIIKTPKSVQLIDGEDLIQMGLEPSPLFSKILSTVENLAIEKKLKTKEEALEFVLKNFLH